MNAARKDSPARTRQYRKAHGLSLRAFGEWFGVTATAVLQWELARNPPLPETRDAIERATGGYVRAGGWPVSKREARAHQRAAAVRPFRPVGSKGRAHRAKSAGRTGTDG